AYLSGREKIALPSTRRPITPIPPPARPLRYACPPAAGEGESASLAPSPSHGRGGQGVSAGRLKIIGARENNLKNLDIEIPLGVFICITGASGSGKSSLINEILYKKLYSVFHDSRVLPGQHDRIEGLEQITDVINIDQSPIGRTPRSNPATYIGF